MLWRPRTRRVRVGGPPTHGPPPTRRPRVRVACPSRPCRGPFWTARPPLGAQEGYSGCTRRPSLPPLPLSRWQRRSTVAAAPDAPCSARGAVGARLGLLGHSTRGRRSPLPALAPASSPAPARCGAPLSLRPGGRLVPCECARPRVRVASTRPVGGCLGSVPTLPLPLSGFHSPILPLLHRLFPHNPP